MNLLTLKKVNTLDLAVRVHGMLNWPAMTRREIGMIKKVFLSLPQNRTLQIFEYGMGFSTLYFSRFLQRQGRNFHTDAVDNNPFWHQRVAAMIQRAGFGGQVSLHIKEFAPCWEKPGWDWNKAPKNGEFAPKTNAEQEYIQLPVSLNKTFDVIFVDGRFRRRCLDVALKCIGEDGVVILHDAQKEKYHSPTGQYPQNAFLNSGQYFPFERRQYQIWFGSRANPIVKEIITEYSS